MAYFTIDLYATIFLFAYALLVQALVERGNKLALWVSEKGASPAIALACALIALGRWYLSVGGTAFGV